MNVIMVCLALIILVSGYKVYTILKDYWSNQGVYDELSEKIQKGGFTGDINFDMLRQINPDVVGWLYWEGTPINYPVVQGEDNDKYLHTLFDGTYGFFGTLFVDSITEAPFRQFNTIVYGHHMKDGSMLASISKLTDPSWCDEHPQLELITPDNKYICAVDEALDQIVIYRLNPVSKKLNQVDILRMGGQTGPKSIHFSKDGRFAYVLCQITSKIRLYSYHLNEAGLPRFELLEEYSTLSNSRDPHDAASSMRLSYDGKYIFSSTAGDDSVACFSIDQETGRLTKLFALPTAGDYPKDLALFPDQKHMAVANNATGTITTFAINYEEKYISMKGKPKTVDAPNCIIFHKIDRAPEVIRDVPEQEALDACLELDDSIMA